MKKCVYAGSFDPVTTGHEEIIKKCSSLFDKTYVALCENPEKKYCFSVAERLDFLKAVCAKYAGVEPPLCIPTYSPFMNTLIR